MLYCRACRSWEPSGFPRLKSTLYCCGVLQGVQIQGTFWRAQAEKYGEQLQEGRVYVFNKFKVQMSNKQYASVKNDYEIVFSEKRVWLLQLQQFKVQMSNKQYTSVKNYYEIVFSEM